MNLFYLYWNDPEASAADLCDQHVIKMGLEAVQVMWTVVFYIGGMKHLKAFREEHPYTKPTLPTHSAHPLVVWAALCRANFRVVCEHAVAIFREQTKRWGTVHSRQLDALWILARLSNIDFKTPAQRAFLETYLRGADALPYLEGIDELVLSPASRRRLAPVQQAERLSWFDAHGGSPILVRRSDPNTCTATEFPQCIPVECRVPGDPVCGYRNCYLAKVHSFARPMAYVHTEPPSWFRPKDLVKLKRENSSTRTVKKRERDEKLGAERAGEAGVAADGPAMVQRSDQWHDFREGKRARLQS